MKIKILLLVCLFSVIGCSGKTRNDRIVTGTVIDIGTCGGNEGFFSGPYECMVSVNVNGRTEYWTIWNKVVKGQPVSRRCYEKLSGGEWKGWCLQGE